MNKKDIGFLKEKLSVLNGQPLRHVSRAADMLCLGFGRLVEKDAFSRDEEGKIKLKKVMIGQYALHIQCNYRMSCGDTIFLAKADLYQPSSNIQRLMDEDDQLDVDLDEVGNNRLDEIVADKQIDFTLLVVEGISINKLGDIKIEFENGFVLESFTSVCGNRESWRFFDMTSEEDHVVVSSLGLKYELDEEA